MRSSTMSANARTLSGYTGSRCFASKASETIVVTGFQQARVASEVKGLAVHPVYNRRFQQGGSRRRSAIWPRLAGRDHELRLILWDRNW